MTTRHRRVYDHRIKKQIVQSLNLNLFPELWIPPSTARSWTQTGPRESRFAARGKKPDRDDSHGVARRSAPVARASVTRNWQHETLWRSQLRSKCPGASTTQLGDHVLLSPIDPAGEGQQKKLKGSRWGGHKDKRGPGARSAARDPRTPEGTRIGGRNAWTRLCNPSRPRRNRVARVMEHYGVSPASLVGRRAKYLILKADGILGRHRRGGSTPQTASCSPVTAS